MKTYVIRRKSGAKVAPADQAERLRWVVCYRFAGRTVTTDGSYSCPNEARAVARELRRSERLDAWAKVAS